MAQTPLVLWFICATWRMALDVGNNIHGGPGAGVRGYICPEDWLGTPPVINDGEIAEVISSDIVICGGGYAGVQAALGAAQGGATVAVLESQAEDTYNFYGNDFTCFNSKLLISRGFGPYKTQDIVNEMVLRGGGRVSSEIIRKYVEYSGETADAMAACVPETSNIFDFDDDQCQVHTAYNRPSGADYPLKRGNGKAWASSIQTIGTHNPTPVHGRKVERMTELQLYCMDAAVALGAEWYFENKATVLVQNADGDVTGVVAKRKDGSWARYDASKGVILATGDFAANADMVFNLLTDVNENSIRAGYERRAMRGPGRDGSGHKMGCWAGGILEPQPRPSMNTMGTTPGPWGSAPFLYLNAKGKRFINEAMAGYISAAIIKQPKGQIAAITDANYMETIKNSGIDHGAPNWGKVGVEKLRIMEHLQEDMAAVPGSGADGRDVHSNIIVFVNMYDMPMKEKVFAASTLDELLGYLGYDGEAKKQALASIEAYNALCDQREDARYGKDPELMIPIRTAPFYGAITHNEGDDARRLYQAGLVTLAGLVTDDNFNVLKSDYTTPVKGLYAAGNCLGQRFGIGYSTPSAGVSIGMAMTHGRVAGKYIATL